MGLIRRAADGGGEGVPSCPLAEALAASNQIIEDMEERMAPPDRCRVLILLVKHLLEGLITPARSICSWLCFACLLRVLCGAPVSAVCYGIMGATLWAGRNVGIDAPTIWSAHQMGWAWPCSCECSAGVLLGALRSSQSTPWLPQGFTALRASGCRVLLARLCLAREELSVVAAERGLLDNPRSDFAEMAAAHQAVLPQGAAAFIKELMGVVSAQRRCACARSLAPGWRACARPGMRVCCGALCKRHS